MVVPAPLTSANPFMDEVLNFLAAAHTAEEILAFTVAETLSERSAYLFDRNRAGELTFEEKIEMDDILRLNHFVNMLKIHARQKLGDT